MRQTVKKFGRMVNKVTNDVTLMPFSIYRPFISLSERIPHVPSTVLYKFPKAVINNVCRGNAHRQLDECVPLAFNYRSILSVQKPLVVCPSARPSIGPVFRAQQHPNRRTRWPVPSTAQTRTSSGPRIFMGAKVKLVAYRVHLLIKYLLTKGNT